MAAVNSRAFEYESIRDKQENKEFWVGIAALVVIVGVTLVCPPAGIALGAAYGVMEVSSAVSGKDWVSGREMSTSERWVRRLLAPLDIIPAAGAVSKFAKGAELARLGDHVGQLGIRTAGAHHVQRLANSASNYATARLRNAANAFNDAKNVATNKVARDLVDVGKAVDTSVTWMRNNLNPGRLAATPDGTVFRIKETAENIHKVETNLKDFLSRFERINLKGAGTGNVRHLDDVPRTKEIEVQFNRNIKHNPEEFARQLKDQEKGMNELTIDEYLRNRERYIAEGRAIEGNAAQQTAREEAFSDKIVELMANGKSFDEAEKEAKEWLNTQAALHNPDQIAGGKPDIIGGMGHRGINSSIGSQWRYRIDVVDEKIREIAIKMTPEELKNTYLNVKLTH